MTVEELRRRALRDNERERRALEAATRNPAPEFSLGTAILAAASGDWSNAGVEEVLSRRCAAETSEFGAQAHMPHRFFVPASALARDLTAGTGSQGGYLTDSPVQSVVDALRPMSVMLRAGVQIAPGLKAGTTVPVIGTTSTVTWLSSEAAAAAETQPVLGSVAVTPKFCSAYVEVSRALVRTANPLTDALITMDLRGALAAAIDTAILAGSGASGQPLGITGTSGIGTFSGTSLAWAGLIGAQAQLMDARAVNNDPARMCCIAPTNTAQTLAGRQRFTGTDAPLWQGALGEGELAGIRALGCQTAPTGSLLLGDFSQVILAEFGTGLQIEVNPVANFAAGIIGFRATWIVDVAVRFPAAFTYASAVT